MLSAHRRVTFLACRPDAREHEIVTQRCLARRLATLIGCAFGETDGNGAAPDGGFGYVVPNETLTSLDRARAFGIAGEDDLFGGVVPHPFVATKTITHPLVEADAAAPPGWSHAFADRVRDVVLPGFAAFSLHDAATAGRRLLAGGAVRIKLACGIGGSGQSVARDTAELDAQLGALEAAEIARHGLVVERNLDEIRTYSVGQVRVGSMLASYYGTQCATRNRHGHEVYGGSTLTVAPGGLETLGRIAPDEGVRRAVAQARTYHAAALACFDGMFASRANYDVAAGHDADGRPHAGVLEQSWRIGGASGAEIAALEAIAADPGLDTVQASTVEMHGPDQTPPDGAVVYFAGVDDHLGPITKYAVLQRR
ncbi:DUF3182 family protein [Piscinibacter koreensis]|uniref:DUF3182 family protein n=1 Tax=Piscinibacter koreensis TaxID=2742824 RepID=A0A7Y6NNV4_9BURK|nr:DUF3182 family protein [Schlegelella koreensis]NUZ06631.1 DUF3182 family protein [Schlegelella koreensis]